MKGFNSNLRFAKDVQADDWFRMCGFLCRVVDARTRVGKTTIKFYSITEYPSENPIRVPESILNVLTLRENVRLKIYNQE